MKHTCWDYHGVKVPMVEDEVTGTLYCTSKVICAGIGVKEKDLENMCRTHPQHFQESLKPSNLGVKEFIREHKDVFGVQRVRKIYTDAELMAFAILSRSPVSVEFMQQFVQFVRSQVKIGFVSQAQHEALEAEMSRQHAAYEQQQQRLELVERFMEAIASDDGRRLNKYKEIKPHLSLVSKE